MGVFLQNRLRYALSRQEVIKIVKDKEGLIKVDGKIRRDHRYPLGIMDVVTIEKTGEYFRILYDVKGRFQPHKIDAKEAGFKLCKVKSKAMGNNKIPYVVTHDGRTIRFPHPDIKKYDTIKVCFLYIIVLYLIYLYLLQLNLETAEVESLIKFENGASCIITGGNNIGRVGIIQHVERHPGSFDIVHIRDARNNAFATRVGNVFVIGEGKKPVISLLPQKGIKMTLIEEREQRLRHEIETE